MDAGHEIEAEMRALSGSVHLLPKSQRGRAERILRLGTFIMEIARSKNITRVDEQAHRTVQAIHKRDLQIESLQHQIKVLRVGRRGDVQTVSNKLKIARDRLALRESELDRLRAELRRSELEMQRLKIKVADLERNEKRLSAFNAVLRDGAPLPPTDSAPFLQSPRTFNMHAQVLSENETDASSPQSSEQGSPMSRKQSFSRRGAGGAGRRRSSSGGMMLRRGSMVSQSDFSLSRAMFATSNFTSNAAKCVEESEVAMVAAKWFGDVIPSVAGAYLITMQESPDAVGRFVLVSRSTNKASSAAPISIATSTVEPGRASIVARVAESMATLRINSLGTDGTFEKDQVPTADPFLTTHGMRVLCVPIISGGSRTRVVAALAITRTGLGAPGPKNGSGTSSNMGGTESSVFSSRHEEALQLYAAQVGAALAACKREAALRASLQRSAELTRLCEAPHAAMNETHLVSQLSALAGKLVGAVHALVFLLDHRTATLWSVYTGTEEVRVAASRSAVENIACGDFGNGLEISPESDLASLSTKSRTKLERDAVNGKWVDEVAEGTILGCYEFIAPQHICVTMHDSDGVALGVLRVAIKNGARDVAADVATTSPSNTRRKRTLGTALSLRKAAGGVPSPYNSPSHSNPGDDDQLSGSIAGPHFNGEDVAILKRFSQHAALAISRAQSARLVSDASKRLGMAQAMLHAKKKKARNPNLEADQNGHRRESLASDGEASSPGLITREMNTLIRETFREMEETLRVAMGAWHATIFLVDRAIGHLTLPSRINQSGDMLRYSLKSGHTLDDGTFNSEGGSSKEAGTKAAQPVIYRGYALQVAKNGRVVNVTSDFNDNAFVTYQPATTVMAVPVLDDSGDVIAVLEFAGKNPSPLLDSNDSKGSAASSRVPRFTLEDQRVAGLLSVQLSAIIKDCEVEILGAERHETLERVVAALGPMSMHRGITEEEALMQLKTVTISLLRCERCRWLLWDEPNHELWTRISSNDTSAGGRITFNDSFGIPGYVLRNREVVNIPQIHATTSSVGDNGGRGVVHPLAHLARDDDYEKATGYRLRNVLCVPILVEGGEIIGVVEVSNHVSRPNGFTEGDSWVLHVVAEHAAIALQNLRLVKESLEMRDSYINAITDLGSHGVMRSIVKRAMAICKAENGSLFIIDNGEGSDAGKLLSNTGDTPFLDKVAGHVYRTGETVNIIDGEHDNRIKAEVREELIGAGSLYDGKRTLSSTQAGRVHTLLAIQVPVEGKNDRAAVLQVMNKRGVGAEYFFSRKDVRLLKQLAKVAALSLKNSFMYEHAVQVQARMAKLLKVSAHLRSHTDLTTLLRSVMNSARSLLNCDKVTVFMLDTDRQELWSKVSAEDKEIRFPVTAGIAGYVARTGEFLHIPEAWDDGRFNKDFDKKFGYRTKSILCYPILDTHHNVIGVTQAINKMPGPQPFDGDDMELLRALTVTAGMAVEVANLSETLIKANSASAAVHFAAARTVVKIGRQGELIEVGGDPEEVFGINEEQMRKCSYREWFAGRNEEVEIRVQRILSESNGVTDHHAATLSGINFELPDGHHALATLALCPINDPATQNLNSLLLVVHNLTRVLSSTTLGKYPTVGGVNGMVPLEWRSDFGLTNGLGIYSLGGQARVLPPRLKLPPPQIEKHNSQETMGGGRLNRTETMAPGGHAINAAMSVRKEKGMRKVDSMRVQPNVKAKLANFGRTSERNKPLPPPLTSEGKGLGLQGGKESLIFVLTAVMTHDSVKMSMPQFNRASIAIQHSAKRHSVLLQNIHADHGSFADARFLQDAASVVHVEGGLIDQIFPRCLVAVFGLEGSEKNLEHSAIRAVMAGSRLSELAKHTDEKRELKLISMWKDMIANGTQPPEMILPKTSIGVSIRLVAASVLEEKDNVISYQILQREREMCFEFAACTKPYGVHVIIGQRVFQQLDRELEEEEEYHPILTRPLDILSLESSQPSRNATGALRGRVGQRKRSSTKSAPLVEIYEVVGIDELGDTTFQERQSVGLFKEGLELYRKREFSKAMARFKSAIDIHADNPCRVFMDRCEKFTANPPPANWKGEWSWLPKAEIEQTASSPSAQRRSATASLGSLNESTHGYVSDDDSVSSMLRDDDSDFLGSP